MEKPSQLFEVAFFVFGTLGMGLTKRIFGHFFKMEACIFASIPNTQP